VDEQWTCAKCGYSRSPAKATKCYNCSTPKASVGGAPGDVGQQPSAAPPLSAALPLRTVMTAAGPDLASQMGRPTSAPTQPLGADPGASYPRTGWQYYHVFVEAQQLEGTGKRSLFGLGAEKMRNVYAWDEVNRKLNELARDGWELLHIEPHWIWGNMVYGAPMWAVMLNDSRRKVEATASYPEYIVGWYCTFRRG
jgi:hypothetical protein